MTLSFSWFWTWVLDWVRRVRRAWVWIVLEFAGVALLIALGLLWTRIPEKNAFQVLLTLLVPVVIAACFLVLHAGTFRAFLRPVAEVGRGERLRVSLRRGAATLLIWIAVGWLLWVLLDRFDDHAWSWASYLNSRLGANARARWASFEHLSRDLSGTGWVLRWVVVPGLLVPLASSAAWGLRRLPWRRVLRLFIDWRWWPAVLACALVGEAWPQTWFEGEPHGTVHQQVTRVMAKLVLAYLLAMACWVKLLGWAAMLLDGGPWGGEDDGGEPVAQPATISGPSLKRAAVNLPLPDTDKGISGNA